MTHVDLALYGVHAAFWAAFGLANLASRRSSAPAPGGTGAPRTEQPQEAPRSRMLLVVHMVAFFGLYFGIAQAVLPAMVPAWFPGQRIAGTAVIAIGAAMMCWARLHFRSWRFRAHLDSGHELATSGPFAIVRHPIYLGLDLLALGTTIWAPTIVIGAATAVVLIGSDLRARAEEKLLLTAFGTSYQHYARRTRRFLPGLY
ncbi:MAG: isoprenylcysteine carboxylmethyltransferase family protein [Kutzneria sp.]|nr:isoprenylcysteine carboxylmethyltransferase family protein [Kutzneria sp.]MBV9843741.1 isoprenylcysteine carboxylmethyltransferase family protein [Kutzneria sp.]